jgi:hypothetical protein
MLRDLCDRKGLVDKDYRTFPLLGSAVVFGDVVAGAFA